MSAGDTPLIANPAAGLTARELDVLRLVAQGRSNAEIASERVISERMVKAHVSNLPGKLQLSDHTRAAILAWREGVMEGQSHLKRLP